MRQIMQNLKSGETILADVPAPGVGAGQVLIRTRASLLSVGTERSVVEFGKGSLIDKARQNPERVRQVLDKVRSDGLMPTFEAVQSKLDSLIPLGYCNSGVVLEVGAGVTDIAVGDRVMSNGPHAEAVLVPRRLCAPIPDNVTDEQAAWVVLGAIALQGIRLAQPTIGETIAVMGLGTLGLLAVQMLKASGCEVLAIDLNAERCELAAGFGATPVCISAGEDPIAVAMAATQGRGADAVILTVATKSDDPIRQAAQMSRQRGRIVLVGVTGLNIDRADFYTKELTFQVSCSYGPGRYDPQYEGPGDDYPVGFVRWTENRNFEAVLGLMKSGAVKVDGLITHRYDFTDAVELYEKVGRNEPILGALLRYEGPDTKSDDDLVQRTINQPGPRSRAAGRGQLGVIGAGSFATRMLVPILDKLPMTLHTTASRTGVSSGQLARKFNFARATTDLDVLFGDEAIDSVLVATRHDSHADLTARALSTGRAVYVEKPLAVTTEQLDAVVEAHDGAEQPLLMVGFNRRFAPMAVKMRSMLDTIAEPMSLVATINAGVIDADHWVHHPTAGGGRIVGEGCHFVDLLRYLVGKPITGWQVSAVSGGGLAITEDKATITLTFADGSFGVLHYLGNGSRAFPKERIEAFAGGRVLQLNDWKSLKGWGWPGFRGMSSRRQDKGHKDALTAFTDAVRKGGTSPMPWDEVLEVSRVSIAVAELARAGGGTGAPA
ncbi:MAG: zinc-binding dehydrogenase [Proteobacteria bacterium]|nr:zinc-binding dehydrogenase [Pseudomonadota bacterium]